MFLSQRRRHAITWSIRMNVGMQQEESNAK
jgi:hypothetical protein